jgi:hypothetical protein
MLTMVSSFMLKVFSICASHNRLIMPLFWLVTPTSTGSSGIRGDQIGEKMDTSECLRIKAVIMHAG